MHAAILELLLKLVASILETLTGSLNVIDTNADMAETLSGLLVSIGDLEVGVVFRS